MYKNFIIKKLIKITSLILCGVVIIFNSACSYNDLSANSKNKISSFSQILMQQISLNITNKAEKIENLCMDISFSQQIQGGLGDYNKVELLRFLVLKILTGMLLVTYHYQNYIERIMSYYLNETKILLGFVTPEENQIYLLKECKRVLKVGL